jgi:hypothetical protein
VTESYVPPTRDEVLTALTAEAAEATDPQTAFFIAIRAAHFIRGETHRPDSFYAGAEGARRVIEQVSGVRLADRPTPRPETVQAGIRQALAEHWVTIEPQWGDRLNVQVCGRCTHGDGVRMLWPCPTAQALTPLLPGGPDAQ